MFKSKLKPTVLPTVRPDIDWEVVGAGVLAVLVVIVCFLISGAL